MLYLNSIGDKNCRPAYIERLRAELEKVRDKLGPDSQRRIATNPLRVLDSKLPEEQAVIATLPRIAEHLCPECRDHYARLKQELGATGHCLSGKLACWCAGSIITCAPRLKLPRRASARKMRCAVADDMMAGRIAGRTADTRHRLRDGTDRLMLSLETASEQSTQKMSGFQDRSVSRLVWSGGLCRGGGTGQEDARARNLGGIARRGNEIRESAEPGGSPGRSLRSDSRGTRAGGESSLR